MDNYILDISHYERKIREINNFINGFGESFIIINGSYWYPKAKYTIKEAVRDYCNKKRIGGYKNEKS